MEVALAIIVRWALFADLMLLFGVPLFVVYALPATTAKTWPALRSLSFAAATIGIVLSMLGIAILAATMSGVALGEIDTSSVTLVVFETAVGTAFLVRIAALAAAVALGLQRRGNRAIVSIIALLGAVALVSLAWSGHGVMDDGRAGVVHLVADIVHLLAAGVWVGALVSLLWLLFSADRDRDILHCVLAGFASVGSVGVGLVLASGLINAWLLVGPRNVLSLGQSLYGQLLLIKLLLFVGMLLLAAMNRFHLTPSLGAAFTDAGVENVTQRLRLSVALETLAAVVILGLVAWLGTLGPPVSMM